MIKQKTLSRARSLDLYIHQNVNLVVIYGPSFWLAIYELDKDGLNRMSVNPSIAEILGKFDESLVFPTWIREDKDLLSLLPDIKEAYLKANQ